MFRFLATTQCFTNLLPTFTRGNMNNWERKTGSLRLASQVWFLPELQLLELTPKRKLPFLTKYSINECTFWMIPVFNQLLFLVLFLKNSTIISPGHIRERALTLFLFNRYVCITVHQLTWIGAPNPDLEPGHCFTVFSVLSGVLVVFSPAKIFANKYASILRLPRNSASLRPEAWISAWRLLLFRRRRHLRIPARSLLWGLTPFPRVGHSQRLDGVWCLVRP